MDKQCKHCKQVKTLAEFFQSPADAAAGWKGTSIYCKQCHEEGKIEHSYGWYGDKWKTPETTC